MKGEPKKAEVAPMKAEVAKTEIPVDADGDGIPDSVDKCPTHQGSHR